MCRGCVFFSRKKANEDIGQPIIIQEDLILKSILIALASGVVLRLIPVIDDTDEHQDPHVKEMIVSWVCDVILL